MNPSAPTDISTIFTVLEDLEQLVATRAAQPVYQFAEHAVLHWLRAVEGSDVLRPRLKKSGPVPEAFFWGLERDPEQRMELSAPVVQPEAMRGLISQRLTALKANLDHYQSAAGYRGSGESCDQVMLEVDRFSRLLACCCLEALCAADEAEEEHVALPPFNTLLTESWEPWLVWEPALNEVIVAWEQNALTAFDAAIGRLVALLEMPEHERRDQRMPPGFPLRARGRPRSKITVIEPVLRPLRGRPIFPVRLAQLFKRLEAIQTLSPELITGLVGDIEHFNTMIRDNRYMLASEPGFSEKRQAGLPLIRGRPDMHPFLYDPMAFFKQAVLFYNGTYTVQGGGVDLFYLQIRQLERYCKFYPQKEHQGIRTGVNRCLRGWEENRRYDFTDGLMALATDLRRRGQGVP